ncbi:MAG TPA: hypothetical protein VFQ42_08940 [Mycobacterium sp.]|nr:hypothetical protein [Mycobacterium sp.]
MTYYCGDPDCDGDHGGDAYEFDGGPRIPGEPTSDGCDVNPICGCHIRALCRGCGTCTTCDGCYCGED